MNLHEFQVKNLFTRYNLAVPTGYVCNTFDEVEASADKLSINGPWVIKCQVHAGGRAKSNAIIIAKSKQEIKDFAKKWLGKRLVTYQTDELGKPVNQLLIEEPININKELYFGIVIDRSINRIVCIVSVEGGIEIETIAKENINLIHKIILDPFLGPQLYQGRELAFKLGLKNNQINQFIHIFMKSTQLFLHYDLSLLEINPLVIMNTGDLICLDGKVNIDNNALFRQLELHNMQDHSQEDPRERYALQCKLNYVALDGNIGCMVNGAGLAMATMDIIKLYGGKPANFLDVGGNTTSEHITKAFKIILLDKNVKAILINIFGGIVRCDLIADGVINAILNIDINIPVVIRLEGNNSMLGMTKLMNSTINIRTSTSLSDAVKQVVMIAGD